MGRLVKLEKEPERKIGDLNAGTGKRGRLVRIDTEPQRRLGELGKSAAAPAAAEKPAPKPSLAGASRAVTDTGTGDAAAERGARRQRYERQLRDIQKQQHARQLGAKNTAGTAEIEEARQQAELRKRLATLDLIDNYGQRNHEDTYGGYIKSQYDIGQLGQDQARAWSAVMRNPTAANLEYAQHVDSMIEDYTQRNQQALDPTGNHLFYSEDAPEWLQKAGKWADDTIGANVQYLPQAKEQFFASIVPAVLGLMAGGVTGGKLGYSLGTALYSASTMAGSAYQALRELGADHETAKQLATDEAFLSSLIEGADTFADLSLFGFGKAAGKLGANVGKAGLVQAAKQFGASGAGKALGFLGNIAQEGLEEGTQQAVSIANRERYLRGYDPAEENFFQQVGGLTGDAARIFWNGLKRDDPNHQEIMESAKGGAQVAIGMGALGFGTGAVTNRVMGDITGLNDPRNALLYEGQSQGMTDPRAQLMQETEPEARPATEPVTENVTEPVTENAPPALQAAPEQPVQPVQQAQQTQDGEAILNALAGDMAREEARQNRALREQEAARREQEYLQAVQTQNRILEETEAQADAERYAMSAEVARKSGGGLLQDEYTDTLDRRDMTVLDAAARQLGVTVSFAGEINHGLAEGQITGRAITLQRDAESPLRQLFGHEIAHRLRDLAPKEFDRFVQAVKAADPDFSGKVAEMLALGQRADEQYSEPTAIEDVAADYAGMLMDKPQTLETFIAKNQHNPTLLQRLGQIFRELAQRLKGKLTGQQRTQAENAAAALEKAYAAAVKAERKAERKSGQIVSKYSLKRFAIDGRRYVDVEADQSLFDGLSKREMGKLATSIIKSRFAGRVIGIDNKAFVNGVTATEYGFPAKQLTEDLHEAKMRASTELDNLLDAGTNFRTRPDGADGHIHPKAVGDFRYFDTTFKVGNEYYSGVVNILPVRKGLLLKDITKIENITEDIRSSYGDAPKSTFLRDVSMQIIHPGETDVKRFSLKKPVEETDKLLALHNKDENSILEALKLGGLPMPSIAVVKARDGHSKYGPISLVFNKDTIDPQLSSANKVYGGDAWTPTAPRVDYPVNSKKALQLEQELHRLAGDTSVAGGIFGNSAALRSMGIDDTSTRNMAELAEKLASTDTVRAAYLADQGKTLEPVKKTKVWDKFGNDTLQKVVDRLGVNTLAEMEAKLEMGKSVETALGDNAEVIRDILRDYYREKGEPMLRRMAVKRGWTDAEINERRQTRIDNSMDSVSIFTLEDIVRHAWDMYQDGGVTKGEIDRMATSDALRNAVDDHAVEDWITGKLDGLLGEAGIYNGKDPFTASGNSRSFSQLHYAYTLENIVKAMKEGQEERGGNTWGASAKTLQSVATPEYRSIQEIKEDSGRLGMTEGTEYEAKLQAIDDQIDSIITKVKQGNSAHSDNPFIESDIIGGILVDTANGKKTVDAIVKAFFKEGYKIGNQTALDIQSVYKAAAEMPTGYFEAKPQRAVGFDEVLAAVIPSNSSQKLRDALEKAGVRTLEYAAGDESDRLTKINSVENARFSLKRDAALEKDFASIREQLEAGKLTEEQADRLRGEAVDRLLARQAEEYGRMQPGEKPAREITLPRRTDGKTKVSRTVRTILEGKATPELALPGIKQLVAEGAFSYEALGDKTVVENANAQLESEGWGNTYARWSKDMDKGVYNKANTAMGFVLYNNAVNSGDTQAAMDILRNLVMSQRTAAQATQATRILKTLSPEAQLYAAQRSIDSLQREITQRYGDKAPQLKISEALAEDYMQAATQQAREAALDKIYQDIGSQLPSSLADRWNAWRYLSMLGNPRTHVRNILGNAFFAPVVFAKNRVGAAMEAAAYQISGGKTGRSKAIVGLGKGDRALYRAAFADFGNMENVIMDGQKLSDAARMNKSIRKGQVVFKHLKALEAFRKANGRLLDAEDAWFCKRYYANALASYAKKNGISAEMIVQNGDGLAAARAYAIREAQRGTYRDVNAFSQMVTGIGNAGRNSKNAFARAGNLLMQGVLPFQKTPANILARGVEYSPLGFLTSIAAYAKEVRRSGITVDERQAAGIKLMDGLSAGLTGTGLMALGFLMAGQGWLRGHGSDDDKERRQEEANGHQAYSLEAGGVSVTLDWVAPEALPVFAGANLYEIASSMKNGDWENGPQMKDYIKAITQLSDPMVEMSMLSGVADVIQSTAYAKNQDESVLAAILKSAATSYVTQALPTLFGQIERVSEDRRYTPFIDKTDFLSTDLQRTVSKASSKILGWDYNQVPYIDAWGREEESGTLLKRAGHNFLNPAYTSKIKEGPLEKELMRVYKKTGDGGCFPSRAEASFKVNGENRYLNQREYLDYARKKGKWSREYVQALIDSRAYKRLSDEEKAEALADAYALANAQAKKAVAPDYQPGSWTKNALKAREDGIGTTLYLEARAAVKPVSEGLRDEDGETIANSESLLKLEQLYTSGTLDGLSGELREALLGYLGIGKKVRGYTSEQVRGALLKMRG